MRSEVQRYIRNLNVRSLRTNTQRVLYRLLTARDGWVRNDTLRVPSASRRIRELREEGYGSFDIECRSAASLNRRGESHTFFYRIVPDTLTLGRIRRVLG